MEFGFLFKQYLNGLKFLTILFFIFTNELVSEQPQKTIEKILDPYILQSNHPLTPRLDAIFGQNRVTLNLKTLIQAGFAKTAPRKFTNLLVTKHPNIPGYVFKMYLDAQNYHKKCPEYDIWIKRILGAQKIRDMIALHQLDPFFKVPQKWIYILPNHQDLPEGYPYKYTILVEEDMFILNREDNKKAWASNNVTPELLNYLWMILKEIGLSDCAKPDNVPFSTDGRISFIDTEIFGEKKINYKKMIPHLSEPNQKYWKELTK